MARYDLRGKTIVVTGAAGGIGASTARALVDRGANVVLVDLTPAALEPLAAGLPAAQVLVAPADVTDLAAMQGVVDGAVRRFGAVDVVFANAGIAQDPPTSFAAADLDAFERVIEVDLLGVVRTIKAALPEIVRNEGQILITSSIYAFVNGVINSPYAASKAAVESLGRSLRVELARDGVSVGVLYPGWITTGITEVARGENAAATRLKARGFRGPLGRFIPPERIARAVVEGLERRAARIIHPRFWAPVSAIRGLVNIVSDRYLAADAEAQRLIPAVDEEARAIRAARER